jgi:hypothetical protein
MTGPRGHRDRAFLERAFHKLLINFTVGESQGRRGRNIFGGGFLGLDNIGIFDRSKPLPTGGHLEQADGTAWMAFFCGTMLFIALELASEDPAYEDVASKFFEHYVAITDAMNALGGTGLWHEGDGFYYDQLHFDGQLMPLKIRSMVGIIPLFVCGILEDSVLAGLPGFRKRFQWFIDNRPELGITSCRARSIAAAARAGHIATASRSSGGCSRSRHASDSFARSGMCSTRTSSCHRTACGRCHVSMPTTRSCSRRWARRTASTMRPGSPCRDCLAGTRTGVGRCGSRPTTC